MHIISAPRGPMLIVCQYIWKTRKSMSPRWFFSSGRIYICFWQIPMGVSTPITSLVKITGWGEWKQGVVPKKVQLLSTSLRVLAYNASSLPAALPWWAWTPQCKPTWPSKAIKNPRDASRMCRRHPQRSSPECRIHLLKFLAPTEPGILMLTAFWVHPGLQADG